MRICANIAFMGYSSVTDAAEVLVTVSIVSHGQGALVALLLNDLSRCAEVVRVVVTQNIPESDIPCPESLQSRLLLIRNKYPLGFGANQNQAYRMCESTFFAVVNPDIRLVGNPFMRLILALKPDCVGVIAPAVYNPDGILEDSARQFPTPLRLLRKFMGLGDGRITSEGAAPIEVDWTAGMFLIFKASTFRELGGFDEDFFLYYEDVDICSRLWQGGRSVIFHPDVMVIHDAQRASRKKLRYLKWHLNSMMRYFLKRIW